MYFILLLILFNCIDAFKPIRMCSQQPPPLWNALSYSLKDTARNWFISRAESYGINWNELVEENKKNIERLSYLKNTSTDYTIEYPKYYTQPFHGYDTGNLNWPAALEGEAASLSMAVNYWKQNNPLTTQNWLRYNVSKNIKKYIDTTTLIKEPHSILDVGCSVGISSEYLYKSFRTSNVTGIDLSPYFVAMAKFRAEKYDYSIDYYHRNAEYTHFDDKEFSLVVCNFIVHEMPKDATINMLEELYRVLIPGGTIAIVDLTPKEIKNNLIVNTFRKWAFEVTEPHIYDYYNRNMTTMLNNAGFINVEQIKNDPINSVWLACRN